MVRSTSSFFPFQSFIAPQLCLPVLSLQSYQPSSLHSVSQQTPVAHLLAEVIAFRTPSYLMVEKLASAVVGPGVAVKKSEAADGFPSHGWYLYSSPMALASHRSRSLLAVELWPLHLQSMVQLSLDQLPDHPWASSLSRLYCHRQPLDPGVVDSSDVSSEVWPSHQDPSPTSATLQTENAAQPETYSTLPHHTS